MPGTRFLFISKEAQIYKVPIPKRFLYKAIPSLADQDVLGVILHYETRNRKPHKLIYVSFQRLSLDNNGQYKLTDDEMIKQTRNFREFAWHSPETLSEIDRPLPIPTAVAIPTQLEKDCLKEYLKEYMPQLVNSGSQVIESAIVSRNKINLENKRLILNASKLRKNK